MTCVSPEAAAALQEALTQTTNHFRYMLLRIHIRLLFTSFFYLLQQRNCAFSSEPLPSSIIYREHIECVGPFLACGKHTHIHNDFASQSSPFSSSCQVPAPSNSAVVEFQWSQGTSPLFFIELRFSNISAACGGAMRCRLRC